MSESLVRLVPTPNYHGYSVKFCPFNQNVVAVATGQNFGLSGNGKLIITDLTGPGNGIACDCTWKDGLFDVTWSEDLPSHAVTASGDGSLQLWNTTRSEAPVTVYSEHKREAYSVDWCQTREQQIFVSASWDATLKVWDPKRERSLITLSGHEALVYQAMWSPHIPGCIASVSGDRTLKIWNVRNGKSSITISACGGEVLTCDWCKYNKNIIATAGTDNAISVWDLRNTVQPVCRLAGHEYPLRRIKYSPFVESQLASVSYDFTTRVWDYKLPAPCLAVHQKHTEFVYGLDFSNHEEGLMADCAWDQTVGIYKFPPASPTLSN
ncbi:peroxisomal targeting signal 2 receptor-like [Macrobrachium nipponense]|uniref:peroxisomal targeting signal 2 receptor-like n=1 Tax=Macrobrachium nipponense TaxID=159736 RepID=UPI0030C8245A